MTTASIPPPQRPPGDPAVPGQDGEDGQLGDRVAIKVWDFPVRLMHWALVACIIVLSVTGFYLWDPFLSPSAVPGAPATGFIMGTTRAVHLTAGWIFIDVVIARIAWSFATSSKWARWTEIIPVQKYRRKLIRPSIEYYAFRKLEAPPVVGHNPLAGLSYAVLFLLFIIQAFTGFALESLVNPNGAMFTATGWIFRFISIPDVRFIHYIIMFLIFGFIINHLYSSVLVDVEDRSGEISSMITGWKDLPGRRVQTAPELQPAPPRPPKGDRARGLAGWLSRSKS